MEIEDFYALKDVVSSIILDNSSHVWTSVKSCDGWFYVHDLRSLIVSFRMTEMSNVPI